MRRGLICLLLLIMATASNSYADVLIGDWEDSTNEGWYDFPTAVENGYSPDPDAWVDDSTLQSSGEYAFDTSWSTEGSQSLRIKMAGASSGNQWGNKVVIGVKNDWFSNSKLEMDVYSDGSWAQIVAINLNSQTFDTTHPGEGFYAMVGGWGTEVWKSGESAQHLVLDYSAFKGGEYSSSTDTYINLVFQVQGGDDANLYFDNVRLLTTVAQGPSPADEATGVSLTPTLSWTAGDYTQSTDGHNVYLGTDFNDVNDANSADTTGIYLGDTNDPNYVITTPLTASTLYYWRVDEVNDADGNSPWKSDVWSFNTGGSLTIKKCTVKAGKTQGADGDDVNNIKDSINISGTANFPSDLNGITTVDVNIVSVDDSNAIIYQETDINFTPVRNKFSYSYKIPKYHAGAITSLKMNFVKNTFSLKVKNIDLTGLSAPVRLDFTMGGNIISGSADETIVNGRKRIHTRLMRMYQDTLIVTKARARHTTRVMSDSLSVKGEIAVEDINNTDMNEPNLAARDVNFIWGDQTFTLREGDLVAYKTGHKYKCSKVPSDANEGVITAKFDLDKCTFTLSIKEVNNINTLPDYPDVNFGMNYGIGDANDFDETADVNLATRRSY